MKNFYFLLLFSLFLQKISAQDVTLDQLMSAPHLTNLTISPKSDILVWVENTRGVRNVMVAKPSETGKPNKESYDPKPLTNWTVEDGQDITNLEWSKDERFVFFVKGNAPQVRGTQPHNPAHVAEGTTPTLYQLEISTKKLLKIGNGTPPSVFGDTLVFRRGGQIFIRKVSDTSATPKQLCFVRNGASSLRFSPDGKQLAFVSARGEHSFIGVFDFKKNDYTFISPSTDQDSEPVWSPDGTKIAFLRIFAPIEPDVDFFPIKESTGWSIIVHDLKTNKTTTAFTADKGMGSAYWRHTGKEQLMWTKGDKIVFCWEKTGWQQLYAVAPTGGTVQALTKGEFEVDEVLLTRDRHGVIYTSNENTPGYAKENIDKKCIWFVDTEGGGSHQIYSSVNAWSINVTSISKEEMESYLHPIYFLTSAEKRPSEVAKLFYEIDPITYETKAKIQIYNTDSLFPADKLVKPESVTLTAKDGQKFNCQVFYPKNVRKDKTHPAVIFVHGGSRRQMLLGYHSGWYYSNAYHLSQYFASQGYIAMSINYRSGIGYGLNFREATNYGASGNSEFQDLEAAGEWLKTHPSVSASKIGVWGGSYGGYMTAMALARRSDLFAAGVDIHGVHNWNTEIPTFMPEYDSLRFPKHAQIAYKSSPVYYIDSWKSPVLLAHGDDDQNVPFSESENIARLLRRQGVDFEQVIIPDEVHGFLMYQSWRGIYEATVDFFNRKLKK
jgi:dipeptidyl aminopeptidase/acylaminoacyl peptidase